MFKVAVSCCVTMLGGQLAVGQSRIIREAPNGDLFVADSRIDAVHALPGPRSRAALLRDEVFASGLKQPFGIAFYLLGSKPRWVYIASSDGVIRFPYKNGDLKASGKPEQIIAGMPTTHHYARDAAFAPNGYRRYVSAGSALTPIVVTACACEGITVHPATGELSCIVDESGDPGSKSNQSTPRQMTGYAGDDSFRNDSATGAAGESGQGGDDLAGGRALYRANCAACHQPGGKGLHGVFPPLKGSGVVNKDDASKHIPVVLNGMQGGRAGGMDYAASMPSFAGVLSDTAIADVIDYARRSWGNHGKPVTAAQVTAERALSLPNSR